MKFFILLLNLLIITDITFSSEKEFKTILEEAKNHFSPLYQKYGKKLTIIGDWEYSENNAKALAYTVDHFYIEIYGGALKEKGTNSDSMKAMICHEVGHHFGGAPFMPAYYEDYYLFRGSSEGQADYYATSICLKNWFAGENHWQILSRLKYSREDFNFCKNYYSSHEKIGLCIRIISAYKRMLGLEINASVNLNLKDPQSTYPYALASSATHPSSKCRLETAYAGIICQNQHSNGCFSHQSPIEASRPLCWAGVGFLLQYEFPLFGEKVITFINHLNIQHFHKDPYDDDEVLEESKSLIKRFEEKIPSLRNFE